MSGSGQSKENTLNSPTVEMQEGNLIPFVVKFITFGLTAGLVRVGNCKLTQDRNYLLEDL